LIDSWFNPSVSIDEMAEKKRKSEKGSVTTVSSDMEAQLEASRLENNQLQLKNDQLAANYTHLENMRRY